MRFLLYSNLWVALCAASFSLVSAKLLRQPNGFLLLFSGTIALYGFHRIYKLKVLGERPILEKDQWLDKNLWLQVCLSFAGGLCAIFLFLKRNLIDSEGLWITAVCLATAILYVVRLGKRNLREQPFAKLFIVSLTYVLFTSFLPYSGLAVSDLLENRIFYFSLWFVVLGITLLFDYRDRTIDDHIQTFPKILGRKRSIYASALLVILGTFMLMYTLRNFSIVLFAPLFIMSLGLILILNNKIKEYQYVLMFEGSLGLFGFLVYFIL